MFTNASPNAFGVTILVLSVPVVTSAPEAMALPEIAVFITGIVQVLLLKACASVVPTISPVGACCPSNVSALPVPGTAN